MYTPGSLFSPVRVFSDSGCCSLPRFGRQSTTDSVGRLIGCFLWRQMVSVAYGDRRTGTVLVFEGLWVFRGQGGLRVGRTGPPGVPQELSLGPIFLCFCLVFLDRGPGFGSFLCDTVACPLPGCVSSARGFRPTYLTSIEG